MWTALKSVKMRNGRIRRKQGSQIKFLKKLLILFLLSIFVNIDEMRNAAHTPSTELKGIQSSTSQGAHDSQNRDVSLYTEIISKFPAVVQVGNSAYPGQNTKRCFRS